MKCLEITYEEPLVAATLVENIDGLDGHLLKARQVEGRVFRPGGAVLEALQVVLEDVAVKPDGEMGLTEDTERLAAVAQLEERRLIEANIVARVGELGVVVLAAVTLVAGDELLGATAEPDVGTALFGPAIVANTVQSLLDERAVIVAGPRVARQSDRRSVRQSGGGNRTPGGVPHPDQQLDNRLDLGVIKVIRRRVNIDAEAD